MTHKEIKRYINMASGVLLVIGGGAIVLALVYYIAVLVMIMADMGHLWAGVGLVGVVFLVCGIIVAIMNA